jgi:hypothetical protein
MTFLACHTHAERIVARMMVHGCAHARGVHRDVFRRLFSPSIDERFGKESRFMM